MCYDFATLCLLLYFNNAEYAIFYDLAKLSKLMNEFFVAPQDDAARS